MAYQGRPHPVGPGASLDVADGIPRELLDRAFAATSEISLITDAQQNILHASRSFTAITGYSEVEVLGTNCRMLQGPGTAPEAVADIRAALARGEKIQREVLNYRKDGSPFWNALKVTPLLDERGQVTHFVSVQRDINARMALHEQLRFQATHDPLTGLPNRAALDAHLLRVLDTDGGSRPVFAVGLIDLDGFKGVNNFYGHEAGDVILKDWAARMQARLQPGEFLARLGGDEFVLVIQDAPETEAPQTLAAALQRLGLSVESPFKAAGDEIFVAMSAGLVLSPRDGSDMRTLLLNADAALKLAKARDGGPSGWWKLAKGTAGNTPAPGSPPPAATSTAGNAQGADGGGELMDLYRERLFAGGLEIFMQPVVDLRDGSLYLFESLARLQLEDGSRVPPAAFLPHLGPAQIARLFRLGLDQVLAQLAEWDAVGLSTKVSVNLAPSTLLDPDCPRFIEEALVRHGIAPQRLVLELLETESIGWDMLSGPLNRLVELGVGLAMDDLGAGYSSLKRLSMLPFTAVKIDRDMLTGLHSSPLETLSLIATLVQIGRDFGMAVVAEGLEDLGMTEAVAVLGAQYGQGYHLAWPMPAAEAPGWSTDFESRIVPRQIRTALGALAYHWKFVRLGSPHPATILECPFTAYLEFRGARPGDVDRWHTQQHRAAGSSGASQMIVDWLISEIRGGS
ncbi:putative bifunctional diguanylate cyclase/phosphodiesterase [Arthrobacter sp. CG_A4]|uniref:putative bifunctional diguanylate cyclase/phosphodiesterase n=1 Tax=Arthrobacter sp. CG_A4 TaxID=3071706 RepID=UPI002E0C2382|nr:diguanylate cyclase (GGDEF)-like protein/PAS domain S-box-containing protein [Arthrobacter sp. CG_A4]